MTPLDRFLTLCRERESKATKGPWEADHELDKVWPPKHEGEKYEFICETNWHELHRGNRDFIASARTAQPALVESLQRAVYELQKSERMGDENTKLRCSVALSDIDILAEQALREMGEG